MFGNYNNNNVLHLVFSASAFSNNLSKVLVAPTTHTRKISLRVCNSEKFVLRLDRYLRKEKVLEELGKASKRISRGRELYILGVTMEKAQSP